MKNKIKFIKDKVVKIIKNKNILILKTNNKKSIKGDIVINVSGPVNVVEAKNEIKFIQNKENRFLEFDQDISHCGFLEKNLQNRIVINFNYTKKHSVSHPE